MRVLVNLFLFSLTFSLTTAAITSNLTTKFSITIKTPRNTSSPIAVPYKSIHVQYMLPKGDDRWNIVEINPFIQKSNQVVQQITVHFCQVVNNIYQQNSTWYDDGTNCNGASSMLIYQWASYSLSSFRIADDLGFYWNKSKSIVLTVTYSIEQHMHEGQAGVILHISTRIPRYHLGTIVVGNKQHGICFSCRSLNYPRLLYGVQPLFPRTNNTWWRIYVIRNRSLGRKLVQYVLDSSILENRTKTDIEIISSDIFLIPGDYIIVECEDVSDSICKFLILYTYKNIRYEHFLETDYTCDKNGYPDLLKLLPSKIKLETNTMPSFISSMDGTTILLLVCLLLFVMWMAIIMGCVIMRRIRGLVNFRPEPMSSHSSSNARGDSSTKQRGNNDQGQQRVANMGDQIAQMDIEHMGLMS